MQHIYRLIVTLPYMLCAGMEELLISDWSSPFGKFIELGLCWNCGTVLLNAVLHRKQPVIHLRL